MTGEITGGRPVAGARATTVLLADDHQLLRQALRRAMEDVGLHVVGEAGDGDEAVRLAERLLPDVVLMDVTMPVLDGIQATRRLRSRLPRTPVIMLTMHGEEHLRDEAVAAGACGFLTKDCSMQEVVGAVTATLAGEGLRPSPLAPSSGPPGATVGASSPLTRREEEVLQLVADGCTTSEIAGRLFISAKTVKNHLASVFAKLGAHDRTQAVLAGMRLGVVRVR